MTTKQEALELLLRKCRGWEAPHEEVKDTPGTRVADAMHRNVMRLLDLREAEVAGTKLNDGEVDACLITIGAAALYLLTDEVTVVAGRSLDEWLKDQEVVGSTERSATVTFPMDSPVGQQMLTILNTGALNAPRPVNGEKS